MKRKDGIKNILIGPNEVAGIGYTLTQAFNKIGFKTTKISFKKHPFGYPTGLYLNLEGKNKILRWLILISNFIKSLFLYDFFVFIFGTTLLPRNLDLPILKFFGKKTAMIFCGCDIRCRDLILKEERKYSVCQECRQECDCEQKRRKIKRIEKYIDVVFSQPDYSQLLSREYEYLWVPIDLDEWQINFVNHKTQIIVHAPSQREKKGTKYILGAVERLRRENYKFDFILLEKLPHHKVKDYLRNSDIVIDQLLMGWHGVFALEAMAWGKPVLCYIREDLKKYSPELPIISTSPENIYENLKLLIEKSNLRQELGRKGRKYVEKYHDSKKIAQKIIDIFENI